MEYTRQSFLMMKNTIAIIITSLKNALKNNGTVCAESDKSGLLYPGMLPYFLGGRDLELSH